MKKTRGRKSRVRVPLMKKMHFVTADKPVRNVGRSVHETLKAKFSLVEKCHVGKTIYSTFRTQSLPRGDI
jgi:hypothetical protein